MIKRMVKYAPLSTLLLMLVFCTSCGGQNKPDLSKDNSKSETKNDPGIHTKYEYTDSSGKRLIIQNSFPRGGPYTDANGKEYFKTIFWTRIINETFDTIKVIIDFPLDSFAIPSSPGAYRKLLLPPDTMTIDKEALYDYGLTGLKSFLDNSIHKPSSLKRTINPKESSGFYVVIFRLRSEGEQGGGALRTGLILKGQDLFYRINENEIYCGSINLTDLVLGK